MSSGRTLAAAIAVTAAVAAMVVPVAPAGAGEVEERTYESEHGSRRYLVAEPSGGGADRPLVVVLHGCTQTAEDIAGVSAFAALGDGAGFTVVFPEQDPRANRGRCWNWFLPAHQTRSAGEPALLAGLTREAVEATGADPERVFVAGLSAGGAMAVVLAATWPDRFTAAASVAGCPYRGRPCVFHPGRLDPEEGGRRVHEAMGPRARPVPLAVVQGDADLIVPPRNAEILVGQWLAAADLADDGTDNGSVPSAPPRRDGVEGVTTWPGSGRDPLVRLTLVEDYGHGWPPGATAGIWAFWNHAVT